MSVRADDIRFMARALTLARRGLYTTHPNPRVGCVIVREGRIVGEGFHARAGEPHAEIHALRMAGPLAHGATAYVTLEPCCHHGRTGPCSSALIEAGVARVVMAMQDPNPRVAGDGAAMLRAAGIEVVSGVLEEEARALNPGFIQRMTVGRPFVRLKWGASLDGRTALANGQSQWITGPEARRDVQFWRAQSSAILSSAETVIRDQARLNVRLSADELAIEGPVRQPVRVILDRSLRLEPQCSIFSPLSPTRGEGRHVVASSPVWIYTASQDQVRRAALAQAGAMILDAPLGLPFPNPSPARGGGGDGDSIVHGAPLSLEGSSRWPNPEGVSGRDAGKDREEGSGAGGESEQALDLAWNLHDLARREINEVWVEAGARLGGALLSAGLVDELILYLAPTLLGHTAHPLAVLPELESLTEARRWAWHDVRRVGGDLRLILRPMA